MEFRVLGPIEAWSAGQQCDLGSARARCVLAMLLLTPRTILPAEVLIDRLWDGAPPPKARESLSVYVARLRASLREAVGDAVRVAGRASGYLLDVDPETIDLHRFRHSRRQADALAASGAYDHAVELLRDADTLWRGEALAGVGGGWVARMRDSLEEERRAAILKRVEYELELGQHADLVGELGILLTQYPLDEAFVGHQMLALYRCGRQADALGLYRETRDRLVDEQGTEPGPALSDLHQRILRGDPGLAKPAVRRSGRIALQDTLPPPQTTFIGRRQELHLLTEATSGTPQVCVIEGIPGVGKTALAVQAARNISSQYADGVFYLDFHSHDPEHPALDGAQALERLLGMMTGPAAQLPDGFDARAALWQAQLGRRRAVVILDDPSSEDQIRPLLPVAGECLILITSRYRLPNVASARVLSLDVLPIEDAVALFRQVAGPGMAHDEDEITDVVRLCGRLPLAIRLTAGRLARDHPLKLADLVQELARPLTPASGPDTPSQEWLSAFEVSYRALGPGHQRFFRRLGMSPCAQISTHAAAALAGSTLPEAEEALTVLLDHHLLEPAPAGQYRFHDLIRDYAVTRAAADDSRAEHRQAAGRLLDYYLRAAEDASRVLHPFQRRAPVVAGQPPATSSELTAREDPAAWLESEWRNILQAAQYASRHEWKAKCADLAHTLAGFLEIRAYWHEAITAHTLALQASRDLGDSARIARAALDLSAVSQQTGRHEATLHLAEEAAGIYRSLADRQGEAGALDQIGVAHGRAGRSREALAYFQEAQFAYREVADEHGVAETLSHSGITCWQLGRYADALAHLEDALTRYRDLGDRRGEAKALNNLGNMRLDLGYHRDALQDYQKSLEIMHEIGGPQHEALLYGNIGRVYEYKGSYEEGAAAYQRALAIFRDIGDLPHQAEALNVIGTIYQRAEQYDEALIYYQKAKAIAEEIGDLTQQVTALRGIADTRRGSGQYGEAFDGYQAALGLARQIGDPYGEAKILEGIAEATLRTQRPAAARIVFRQALDIYERLGVPEAEAVRLRIEMMEPALARHTS